MPGVLSDERLLSRMGLPREVWSFWSSPGAGGGDEPWGVRGARKTYLNLDQVQDIRIRSRFL